MYKGHVNHATGLRLLATCAVISVGGVWAGCSNSGSGDDGGTDGSSSDVNSQDTSNPQDAGTKDVAVDASALDCNTYCTTIATVCAGTDNQYKDNATCLSMCQLGIPNDAGAGATTGNSLACRMTHLASAAQEQNAATDCSNAGPYGYGGCGSLCDDFCNQYFTSLCKTDQAAGYASEDTCRTYCNQAAGADASAGAPGNPQSTPSMLCRQYHLENAVQTGGTGGGHCDHAGEAGAGVCN
jgi:hypothetical protein